MTLKDAIKSSLTILKQVMEEKLNATNIEVCPSILVIWIYLLKCVVETTFVQMLSVFIFTFAACSVKTFSQNYPVCNVMYFA